MALVFYIWKGGLFMRWFICVLSMLSAGLAHADSVPNSRVNVGNWTVEAFNRDGAQILSHCTASARYKSDTLLTFAIDSDRSAWRIGLANESWALPQGQRYQVSYFVDGDRPANADAIVFNKALIVFELPPTARLFTRLRQGRILFVSAAGAIMQFDLTNSSRALSMATGCTEFHQKAQLASRTSSNPFAPAVNAAPDDVRVLAVNDPALRREAEQSIGPGLALLGIKDDVKIGMPDGEYGKIFHAIFTSPSAVGGMTVLPGVSPADATNFAMTTASNGCPSGSFMSGRKELAEGITGVTTKCKKGQEDTSTDYVIAARGATGSVLMTVVYSAPKLVSPPPSNSFIDADYHNAK